MPTILCYLWWAEGRYPPHRVNAGFPGAGPFLSLCPLTTGHAAPPVITTHMLPQAHLTSNSIPFPICLPLCISSTWLFLSHILL